MNTHMSLRIIDKTLASKEHCMHTYFSDLYFSRMACCGSVSALRKVSFSAIMHSLKWENRFLSGAYHQPIFEQEVVNFLSQKSKYIFS